MTPPDPLPDPDDLLAAEYVLGTLDGDERVRATARLASGGDFATRVSAWTQRLEPLSEATAEQAPPSHIWPGILERLGLGVSTPANVVAIARLQRTVRRWRLATGAATAIAACLAGLAIWARVSGPSAPAPTLIAVLQRNGAESAVLVRTDLDDRKIAFRALDAAPPPGQAFQLWMIEPSLGAPKSLGVTEGPGAAAGTLPPGTPPEVARRATYAVTIEPKGGSPTGSPSGTPLYVGHLSEPF